MIVDLIERLRPGGKLEEIQVSGNPLAFAVPGGEPIRVPPEVLSERDPVKLLAELRRLMPETVVDKRTGAKTTVVTSETVDWIRATVLGRKEIGKSHLFRRLIFKPPFRKPPKTQAWESGILRMEGVGPKNRTIFVRVHDLGGDPDLHGAHSTFLSDKRNCYLAVCNASESRGQSLLDYWMRVVRAYGVFHETEQDQKPRAVIPPTTVLLSWCDKEVHADFASKEGVAESIKQKHRPLQAIVVDRYWDPDEGKTAGDLKYDERLEAVRDAIRDMVKMQHAELDSGYAPGFKAAIADFDSLDEESKPKKSLLDAGPMTMQAVREAFFDRTQDPIDKTSDVGIGLLRNIGLAICPELDASDRKDEEARSSGAEIGARLKPPTDDPANLRQLRGLVFGVEWLKAPTYHLIRTGHFDQKMGVATRDVLIEELTKQLSDNETWAEQVLELLKWQRLVFPYAHANKEKYLIVDRLKPLDVADEDDHEIKENQERKFNAARKWFLQLDMLLDSHLPQFIGHAYATLTGKMYVSDGAALSQTIRRDRIVVRCGVAEGVEALLTVDLNEAQVHARVIGGTAKQQDDFVAQIGLEMMRVTGKVGRFEEESVTPTQRPAVGDRADGTTSISFTTVERCAMALLLGKRKWFGNRKALADAIGLPDQSQISKLLNPTLRRKLNPHYNARLAKAMELHEQLYQKRGRRTISPSTSDQEIEQLEASLANMTPEMPSDVPQDWKSHLSDRAWIIDKWFELFPDTPREQRTQLEAAELSTLVSAMLREHDQRDNT
ncbi:MAG TPA: hypothetical protein PLD59_04525 [Tepidisphaeraceae bacterium]|nr:hypothetical protein [Tepidisphaeraceae bacterium]